MMRGRMIVLVIGAAVTLAWAGYTLDYSVSQFSFYKEDGFDRINAKGFIFDDEPGTPELPSIYLHYIIPPDVKVESLIEIQYSMDQVPGRFRIYPTQPPVVQGETVPWIPPDTLIYGSNDFYPENCIEIVNEGVIDGARIVTVAVHPLVYRPQSKRLYIVTHVDFDFAFGQNAVPDVRALVRGEYEQVVHDAALERLVENDFEIPVYYQKPTIVEYDELGTRSAVPMGPAMIITDPTFASTFQPYVDWLTDQGIKAQLISPQLIYANFSGVDEADKIRNYIKDCYRYAGGTWFILGGMDNRFSAPVPPELPSRRCFCVDFVPGATAADTVPCDHYYCALDGDWNADGDDTWGEMNDEVDQFPEVYVGRILCRNVQEVENWVYKALVYERTPGDVSLFDMALWIYQNGVWPNKWYMGTAIEQFPDHFTHVIAENFSAYEVLNLLDRGYGFTHGQTHGSILCFPTGYPGGSVPEDWIWSYWPTQPTPANDSVGVNWLTNEDRYFIHYAVSCNTAFYDDYAYTCIAQGLTTKYRNANGDKPTGACASIEHTRYSVHSPSHVLQDRYYGLLFTQEYPGASFSMIGYSLAQAKTQMIWHYGSHRYVCYSTNLFGSPTTPAWTNVPGNIVVTHPSSIPVAEPVQFVVRVNDEISSEPVAYAKVCVNKQADVYMVNKTDEDGQVTFSFIADSVGTLKVTVTRYHNDGGSYIQYLPSQTTCQVTYYRGDGEPQTARKSTLAPDEICITQMPTLMKDFALIKYGVPEESEISLVMYDITGSRAKTIKQQLAHPGYYEEKIDTKYLANGVYFLVLIQNNEKVVKKCIVLK